VALVVAETFELARYAAKLVRVEYAAEAHETNLREKWNHARTPKPRNTSIRQPHAVTSARPLQKLQCRWKRSMRGRPNTTTLWNHSRQQSFGTAES